MKKDKIKMWGWMWIILSVIASVVYLIFNKGEVNLIMIMLMFFIVGGFLMIYNMLYKLNFNRIFSDLYKIEKMEGHSEAYFKEYLNVIDKLSKKKMGNIQTLQLTLTSLYYDKGQLVKARSLFEKISIDAVYNLSRISGYSYLLPAYYNNGLLLYTEGGFIDKADAIFIAGKNTIDNYMDKNTDLMTLIIFKTYLLYFIMKNEMENATDMADRINTHILFDKHKSAAICVALAQYYKKVNDLEKMEQQLTLAKEYNQAEKYPSDYICSQINEIGMG